MPLHYTIWLRCVTIFQARSNKRKIVQPGMLIEWVKILHKFTFLSNKNFFSGNQSTVEPNPFHSSPINFSKCDGWHILLPPFSPFFFSFLLFFFPPIFLSPINFFKCDGWQIFLPPLYPFFFLPPFFFPHIFLPPVFFPLIFLPPLFFPPIFFPPFIFPPIFIPPFLFPPIFHRPFFFPPIFLPPINFSKCDGWHIFLGKIFMATSYWMPPSYFSVHNWGDISFFMLHYFTSWLLLFIAWMICRHLPLRKLFCFRKSSRDMLSHF